MRAAYYNEIDPYVAQWLRNLIVAGHVVAGDVDERSIRDVRADDLRGYGQCHFFAGIGGWSLALRLAGWPDGRPVWTGSCPCQPFSAAGKGKAADDERHLWPAWFPLIAERRPPVVFGEQVEAAIGWGWLDAVFADLEGEGYACASAVLPACGVGAPHIRQRVWFVADARSTELDRVSGSERQAILPARGGGVLGHATTSGQAQGRAPRSGAASGGDGFADDGILGHADPARLAQRPLADDRRGTVRVEGPAAGAANSVGLADDAESGRCAQPQRTDRADGRPAPESRRLCDAGFWSDADWIWCRDGKYRPVEPGSFPLAHGVPGRVGKLRAYGNAITPQAAAEFIAAWQACRP